MSVDGAKASGKYYAILERTEGVWRLASGRVELADGRSIKIEGPSEVGGTGGAEAAGGRQLKSDPGAISDWREAQWVEQGMRFRVPADWRQSKLNASELDFRWPEKNTAYFVAHASAFPQPVPAETVFTAHLQTAVNQLSQGEIAGYAVKKLGRATGVLSLGFPRQGDGTRMITWTGFVQTGSGQKSVTILLGAEEINFDRLEPIFGAILDSIRFS
jgi:hypothetical protein